MSENKRNEKRRDNKNRLLHTGESQRSDGRYAYKYYDNSGQQHFVYSWKLTKTDKIPTGKRDCLSLRELEEKIKRDLADGISYDASKMTVSELVERYISLKRVKASSMNTYQRQLKAIQKSVFGKKYIRKVKPIDIKSYLIQLQDEGFSFNWIQGIKILLKASFEMAVSDDLLRKNPINFKIDSIVSNDTKEKQVLNQEQKEIFLNFIRNDRYFSKYYETIYILFHTGLRISELCGLTIHDVDMRNKVINVNKQVQKIKSSYVIGSPKSKSSIRQIPMTQEVYECFQIILSKREKNIKIEMVIDGVTGFLFTTVSGNPMINKNWVDIFNRINERYNKSDLPQIPRVTAHVCRHTFCSEMVNSGMNPKILQNIMGHADIGVTLNTYTHINFSDIKKEMKKVSMGC